MKEKGTDKEGVCMMFYSKKGSLHHEADASKVGLETSLPQERKDMNFPIGETPDNKTLQLIPLHRKDLSIAEIQYRNTEGQALCILHGPEKFHYFCLTREVNVIIDHKTLINI